MDHAAVIRKLIERTASDFVSYFEDSELSASAERIIRAALTDSLSLPDDRELIEWMIPDIDDDGRWEASYALNTGVMVLSLIDYQRTGDEDHYRAAVSVFFDSVDFKVHQELESRRATTPSQEEIAAHPLFVQERAWFASVEAGA